MAKTTDKQQTKGIKPVTIEHRINRIEATLKKIERKVSDDAAFRLLIQSLVKERNEQTQPAGEQGLEPGDYTDASKEVADELTAIGYGWWQGNIEAILPHIAWGGFGKWSHLDGLLFKTSGSEGLNYYHCPEFIARARVTAKRIGLVPVDPKPWKPEVGQYVKPSPKAMDGWVLCPPESGVIERIDGSLLFVREPNLVLRNGIESWRYEPMSPEEVAAYKEQQELAKPIVFGTKVKMEGREWVVVSHKPDLHGYSLNRATDGDDEWRHDVKRHEFTVIP